MSATRTPPRNLAVRLARSLSLVALAVIATMMLAHWRIGVALIEGESTDRARESAETLATSVASAFFELSDPGVASAVDAAFRQPHVVQVVVWAQDGRTPWASFQRVNDLAARIDHPTQVEEAVSIRAPVYAPELVARHVRTIGYVEVWSDMGLARKELNTIVLVESAQLAGLVVVLTGIAFLIAMRQVVGPTAQLGQALQEVGTRINRGEPTQSVQAAFEKASAPLRDQGAEVDEIIGEFHHVFETVVAREQQLQDREAELANVLNTTLGVIYVTDIQQRKLLYANDRAHRYFRKISDSDGIIDSEKLARWFHPEDFEKLSRRFESIAAGEAPEPARFVLREALDDGTWRYWDSVESPFHLDASGKPTHIVGHAIDVTQAMLAHRSLEEVNLELERKVAARTEALERINSELEAFSYSVSHDLRTPLRAVDGFSRIILEDYGTKLEPDCRALFDRVIAASDRMSQLIDAMLQLARASRAVVTRGAIDVSEIADSLVQSLRAQHPEREVEVVVQPGMRAHAYPQLFESILQNLLVNSWTYTSKREQARIEVGANHVNGETIFYVRDNGEGFDTRMAEKMFAPFQRLHPNDEHDGVGIGLSTAKRLVHRHGGRIWADGEVGVGSTFWFTVEPKH